MIEIRSDNALLKVNDLSTHFYTYRGIIHAIDNVSFTIEKNECMGLVGETGCGKSVTALSIIRLLPSEGKVVSGEVVFEGKNLLKRSEKEMNNIRGEKISMIFQEPTTALNPVFKIGTQMTDILMHHTEMDKKTAAEKAVDMLDLVGMPDSEERLRSYPHELSVGMRQRVMIAMALLCEPSLLIADEPTTALDVTIESQILRLIREVRKRLGTAILYITHNLGIIAEIGDMVGVMYCGNIVEYGSISEFFENPAHPYTKDLIGAIPKRKGLERKGLKVIKGSVPDMVNPPSGCRFHPRCRYAKRACSKARPEYTNLEKNHKVACYLF